MNILGLTIAYDHRATADTIDSLRIERAAMAQFKAEQRAERVAERKQELAAEAAARKEAIAKRLEELKAGTADDLNAGAA